MPIIGLQRRMRELGRIRMGDKGEKGQPRKLGTFRLTSSNREYLDVAQAAYGGAVASWESPRGPEWQLTIAAPYLDVIIPPEVGVDPWLELWTGGGCVRRCDGVTESLSGQPCLCPSDPKERQAAAGKGEACKPTTRLSVCLPALPDLGVWRLESHGYYAAVELSGMAEVLRSAALQGVMLPARLRIDRRQVKRPNEPRRDFVVPVLEIPTRLGELIPAGGPVAPQIAAPAAVGRPALPPGPALPAASSLRAPAPEAADATEAIFAPEQVTAGPLTTDELKVAIHERGISTEALVAAKKRLFPAAERLTDEQRGVLLADLVTPSKEE